MLLRSWLWVQEPDGLGEETPPESLCFCHQAAEALTRWQPSEKTVTRVIWVFDDLTALPLHRWGRCPAERGEPTQRYAQLSANSLQGFAILAGAVSHTTLRCTESIHFLWSLHRKFSGLLVRPWFPQLSQVVQSLPGFLNLCLDVCSPSQVPRRCLRRGTWSCLPLSTGVPLIIRGV